MADFDSNDFVRQFGNNYPRWLQDSLGSQLKEMNAQLERISNVSASFSKTVKESEKHKNKLNKAFSNYVKTTEDLLEQQKKSLKLDKNQVVEDKKSKKLQKEHDTALKSANKELEQLAENMNVSPNLNVIGKQSSEKITNFTDNLVGFGLLFGAGYGAVRLLWGSVKYLHRLIDETREAYSNMVANGISVNGGFMGLRDAMARQGYTLEMMTQVIGNNTKVFNTLGVDAFNIFSSITGKLHEVSSVTTKYAMSFMQIDEFVVDYLEIERLRGNLRNKDTKSLSKNAERQIQVMTEYSSVLGKARKDIMREIAEQERKPMRLIRKALLRNMGEAGKESMKRLDDAAAFFSATIGSEELRETANEMLEARILSSHGINSYSNELLEKEAKFRLYAPEIFESLVEYMNITKTGSEEQIKLNQAEFVRRSANIQDSERLYLVYQSMLAGMDSADSFGNMITEQAVFARNFIGDLSPEETLAKIEKVKAANLENSPANMAARMWEIMQKRFRSFQQTLINHIMESGIFAKVIDILDSGVSWLEGKIPQVISFIDYAFENLDTWYTNVETYISKFYTSIKSFFSDIDENGKTGFDKLIESVNIIVKSLCWVGSTLEKIFGKDGFFDTYVFGLPELISSSLEKVFGVAEKSDLAASLSDEIDTQTMKILTETKGETIPLENPSVESLDIDKIINSLPKISEKTTQIDEDMKRIKNTMDRLPKFDLDPAISKQLDSALKGLETDNGIGVATGYENSPVSLPSNPMGNITSQQSSETTTPKIPYGEFAKGGVVTGDMLARIGEGSSPEMVLPLDPAMHDLAEKISLSFTNHYGKFEEKIYKGMVTSLFVNNSTVIHDIMYEILDKFFYSKNDGGDGLGQTGDGSMSGIMSVLKLFGIDLEGNVFDRNKMIIDPFSTSGPGNNTVGGVGSNINTNNVGEATTNAEKDDLMLQVYDAFRAQGMSHEGAMVMVGEVGRENNFNKKHVFGSHKDPYNNATNVGMFSWQKERGNALLKRLKEKGLIDKDGNLVRSKDTINEMAKFATDEMKNGGAGFSGAQEVYDYLSENNKNFDYNTATRLTGKKYVKWRMDDPRYSSHQNTTRSYYNRGETLVKERKKPETVIQVDPPKDNKPMVDNVMEDKVSSIQQPSKQVASLQIPFEAKEQMKDIVAKAIYENNNSENSSTSKTTPDLSKQVAQLVTTTNKLANLVSKSVNTMDAARGSVIT